MPEVPAIYGAAIRGDNAAIDAAIRDGASVDEPFGGALTPLFMAAYNGHDRTVAHLLARGADPNHRNADGETALIAAMAHAGADRVVPVLLAGGADPSVRDKIPRSALVWAAGAGRVGAVKAILATGDRTDSSEAVLAAISADSVQTFAALAGARVPPPPLEHGRTLLHIAAAGGSVEMVRVLAPIVGPSPVDGSGATPLGAAAYFGHTAVVEALVRAGADPNHRPDRGDTALHAAAWTGQAQTVAALLRLGADPELTDAEGRRAVDIARAHGHTDVVRLLGG